MPYRSSTQNTVFFGYSFSFSLDIKGDSGYSGTQGYHFKYLLAEISSLELFLGSRWKFKSKNQKVYFKALGLFLVVDSGRAGAMITIYLMEKLIDKPTSMTVCKVSAKNRPLLFDDELMICCRTTLEI